jgi:hypothetical protein
MVYPYFLHCSKTMNGTPLRSASSRLDADLHRMLDRHAVPGDHAGQELSLQGRVQEFAFMAAAGSMKFAQRAG